ncbi:MAG: hypothetical protein QXR30_04090 [Candidatus Woesearchaeota archaeon]
MLLVFLLFFFIRSDFLLKNSQIFQKNVISTDLEPIRIYVDGCLKSAVNDNLLIASLQGGYVDTSEVYEYISLGRFKIPYYYNYYSSKAPSFTYLKTKLEEKIASDIVDCLKGLEKDYSVKINFDTISFDLENMRVILSFTDEYLIAYLKLSTQATLKDGKIQKETKEYSYRYSTNFYKFYKLAKHIAEVAAEQKVFEKLTIEVIASHLPYKGYYFGYNYKFPKISEAKEKLFNALRYNFNYIVIPGFSYVDISQSIDETHKLYQDYYKQQFSLNLDFNYYDSNIFISFTPVRSRVKDSYKYVGSYLVENDDFYFSVKPSIGDTYKPINIKLGGYFDFVGYIPILPLYIFDYSYYVDYGVLVTLRNTKNDELFYFGLRPKVRTETSYKEETNEVVLPSYEEIINLEDVPDCEGEIDAKILVYDQYLYTQIKDADVYYYCAGITCYVGKTKLEEDGFFTGITRKLPFCYNPLFYVKANGYYIAPYQHAGMPDDTVQIPADKLYDVQVELRFYNNVDDLEFYRIINPSDLNENEEIMILFSNDVLDEKYVINNSLETINLHLNTFKKKYNVMVVYVEKKEDEDDYEILGNYYDSFEAVGYETNKIIIPLYNPDVLKKAYEENNVKKVKVITY